MTPPPRAGMVKDHPAPVTQTITAIQKTIHDSITQAPRSLQAAIGPSEIGNACVHCLAARLAGWPKTGDAAWLPWIGTAVHTQLENTFMAARPAGRWRAETRVTVGHIDGRPVTGSNDLVDLHQMVTVDWKIVGASTLTKARAGQVSNTYLVQQMLYARGWHNQGVPIEHVLIAFLPRNAVSLSSAVWWAHPYDEQIATGALDRATAIARALKAFPSVAERDAWISTLPRADTCWDCPRYPDAPKGRRRHDPAPSLLDLIEPTSKKTDTVS